MKLEGPQDRPTGDDHEMTNNSGKDAPRAKDIPGIPDFLRRVDRWLTWSMKRNAVGKMTKAPHGSVLNPDAYGSFDTVADEVVTPERGIGFVFTGGVLDESGGLLIGLDVDACREPKSGALSDWAKEVWEHYGRPFTEITPSGAGLRIWLLVENPPNALPRIRIPADAPEGVKKQPEIQVFGCGSAQYVTVTGRILPGSSDRPGTTPNLSWLQKRYRVDELEETKTDMPIGEGTPPTDDEIEERLATIPKGAAMIAGDWGAFGVESASELWYRLVKHALKAAGGHGEAAADFLLGTPWGLGLVDSRDPDRYARDDWVYKDVARISGKAGDKSPSEVFQPIEGDWEPPQAAQAADKGSRLVPWAEFVAQAEEQRFLVYGHLPARGLAQLFGDPGCGKTPYALSLAIHVATGAPTWFGFDVERHGPVVYLVGEDASGVRDRMVAQVAAMGKTVDDGDLHVSTMPARLMEPGDCLDWVKDIKAACGGSCALLVVDTQQANFGPGNENATDDMGAFIDNLKAMTRHLGCLVLLVHHTGHAEKARGRGSSTLPGALDAQFLIEKAPRGMVVTATSTKSKNWQAPEPLVGSLHAIEIGADQKGRPITAVTLKDEAPDPSSVFAEIDEARELLPLLGTIHELGDDPTTQAELGKLVGIERGLFRAQVKKAIEYGMIDKKGGGKGKTKTTWCLTPQGLTYWAQNEDDIGGLLG